MSLGQVNKKFERTVVNKGSFKLILTEKLLNHVQYLHDEVSRNTEWSGILISKVTKGSIEDIKNLEIVAEDILLMDVGTSGYTEYEFDSSDSYMVNGMADAFMDGKKMGHCHSHHSMTCFFSGTDMSELHDNAPNHNWYLSLIVNYDDTDKWCAKIAMCVDEKVVVKGIKEKTYKGAEGLMTVSENVDIDTVAKYLYTYDAIIEPEMLVYDVDQSLMDRLDEIKKSKAKKASSYTSKYGIYGGKSNQLGFDWADKDYVTPSFNENTHPLTRKYEYKEVQPFVIKLLSCDLNATPSNTLWPILEKIDSYNETEKELILDQIEDNFEEFAVQHFEITNKADRELNFHYLCETIEDVLEVFKKRDFVKRVLNILDVYIINAALLENFDNETI